MSTTLTIRNLDKAVKLKLRVQAATHGRAMEAEAREILTRAVTQAEAPRVVPDRVKKGRRKSVCVSVRGIWKDRISTDDILTLTRGD